MQNTIWKLSTLAAVIGCCFLTVLVLKEQKDSLSTDTSPESEVTANEDLLGEPSGALDGASPQQIELIAAESSSPRPMELANWDENAADSGNSFAAPSESAWGQDAEPNPFETGEFNNAPQPNQFANNAPANKAPAQNAPPQQLKQLDEPRQFPEFGSEPEPSFELEEPAPQEEAFSFEGQSEPAFGDAAPAPRENESRPPAFGSLEPEATEEETTGPSFDEQAPVETSGRPLMVATEEEAFGDIEEEPAFAETEPEPIKSRVAAATEQPTPLSLGEPEVEQKNFDEPPTFALQPEGNDAAMTDEDPFSEDLPAEELETTEFEGEPTPIQENEPTPLPVFEMNLAGEPEPAVTEEAPQMLVSPDEAKPLTADSPADEFIGVGVVTDDVPQGLQKPEVTLEKIAPETVILGEPMVYQIIVKNVGGSTARNVVVEDRIPRGAKLTGTKPQAEMDANTKTLKWQLGDLPANEEVVIAVRVEPTAEGEIGSVSTVNFVAEIGATTKVTAPKVEFDFEGPETAEIGQSVLFKYIVKNTGSADAQNVLIRNLIPEALSHPAGHDLEYEIGNLKAGEEKEVKLMVMAVQLGEWENVAVLTAAGEVKIKDTVKLKIGGNRLSLSRKGPKARYLGKEASFETTVTNDSDTVAKNVTVSEAVPAGMKFVSAGEGGQFDPVDKVIRWIIPQLAGKSSATLHVVLEAIAEGEQESKVTVSETYGKPTSLASMTSVKGYSTVSLLVKPLDEQAGVEIGETIVMNVQAQSKGTTPSTAVKLTMTIPEEMEIITIKGPAKFHIYDNRVEFEEIATLDLSKTADFELKLRAKAPGDVRFKVSAESTQMRSPVSQEEAILILN